MPGAAIECVEMNWANFIGGGFLLGEGKNWTLPYPHIKAHTWLAAISDYTGL